MAQRNSVHLNGPNFVQFFSSQHFLNDFFFKLGMLKDQQDGSVLKAAVKPVCGAREITFYENLMGNSSDPSIAELRKLVPEYRGTVKMSFRGKTIDFIRLADISHDMGEPCVMDIKIGRRTWDPLATPQKIQAEKQKYEACKQNLGFCIPGFQVYDIKTGRIKRFGKEYGKKLNQNSVKDGNLKFFSRYFFKYDFLIFFVNFVCVLNILMITSLFIILALKIFLNADTQLSRTLLKKFLSTLRSVQTWARSQTSLRLYSSSLLLAYDAKRLKNQIFCNRNYSNNSTVSSYGSLSRSSSIESTSKLTPTSSSGSDWQPSNPNAHNENINANGCFNSNNDTLNDGCNGSDYSVNNTESIQIYKQLQRSHSTQNNYEEV